MITVVATFAMGEARRMTVLRKSTDAYRVIEERMGARGWRAWHRGPAFDTHDPDEAREYARQYAARAGDAAKGGSDA